MQDNYNTYFKAYDKAISLLTVKAITDKEYIVLTYLYRRADEYGLCYPSLRTIEKETGISKSSVQRIIKKLAELQIINIYKIKSPRDNKKEMNIYEIIPPELWKVDLPEEINNPDYIDSNLFKEIVIDELKKIKKDGWDRSTQSQIGLNQELENTFSKNLGRKEYINNKTKEKDIYLNVDEEQKINSKIEERKKEIEELNIKEIKDSLLEEEKARKKAPKNGSEVEIKSQQDYKDFTKADEEDFKGVITKRIRWKLYSYRQFYKDILDELERYTESFSRDELLFLLINTEQTGKHINEIVKKIISVDRKSHINNKIFYLLRVFGVDEYRFAFLLRNYNPAEANHTVHTADGTVEKTNAEELERKRKEEEEEMQKYIEAYSNSEVVSAEELFGDGDIWERPDKRKLEEEVLELFLSSQNKSEDELIEELF